MLHRSGLTPEQLSPEQEHRVVEHGICLTDLIGGRERYDVDVDALVSKVEAWRPEWLAFTSKGTAQEAARVLGERRFHAVGLGPADWYVGGAQVFVLPGHVGGQPASRLRRPGRPALLVAGPRGPGRALIAVGGPTRGACGWR